MSRLDYVTIAIVGICIIAILFLVYKMTNVFNGDKAKPATEIAADSTDAEDEDVYDYEIDENVDSTGDAKGNTSTDKAPTTKPATSTTETTASSAPAEDDAAVPVTKTPSSTKSSTAATTTDAEENTDYSEGNYLVLAGSFTLKSGAEAQVKKLNKLGYDNAKMEIFDRGKYAVVVVDRFDNMADAERLVKKLSGNSIKSYVKAKS